MKKIKMKVFVTTEMVLQGNKKGPAFSLIKKMLGENQKLGKEIFQVTLVGNASMNRGLNIVQALENLQLKVERVFFTGNGNISYIPFVVGEGADLFLTHNMNEAQNAVDEGIPSASINTNAKFSFNEDLTFVFDGDCVIFDDELEYSSRTQGVEKALEIESYKGKKNIPLKEGPLSAPFMILSNLRAAGVNIKLYLLTARSTPAYKRAVNTLNLWGVEIDSVFFTAGGTKKYVLSQLGAHIFLDDSQRNIDHCKYTAPSAQVPYPKKSKMFKFINKTS